MPMAWIGLAMNEAAATATYHAGKGGYWWFSNRRWAIPISSDLLKK